jgi:hypothetical protein
MHNGDEPVRRYVGGIGGSLSMLLACGSPGWNPMKHNYRLKLIALVNYAIDFEFLRLSFRVVRLVKALLPLCRPEFPRPYILACSSPCLLLHHIIQLLF